MDIKSFKKHLIDNRHDNKIRIVYDIETLQYNELLAKDTPSLYKNITYSFAIGYLNNDNEIGFHMFNNSKEFFDIVIDTYKKWKKTPKIELVGHNGNKYDNHYVRNELIKYYDLPVKNLYLKQATENGNIESVKKSNITASDKKGLILEKRVKSSINLECTFFIDNIEFFTTDNYVKTNASIETLGQKLLNLGLISEEETKPSYDYEKYNKDEDMSEYQAEQYAKEVFENLTEDEKIYIKNDIIILIETIRNYSKMFKGFDYEKITFTRNILDFYNDNDLTSFQLLKKADNQHVKYTDYYFDNENLYDYFKSFYNGGLNFYNDKYIGVLIKEKLFAIDINSSYPYAMYGYKVPTFIHDYGEFENYQSIKLENKNNDNFFYMYRLNTRTFDDEILSKISSRLLKQMLVKYYSRSDYININSYTIKLIEDICDIKIEMLTVKSFVSYECHWFGSNDKISEMYEVKTQGTLKNKIIYNNPFDITITDELNTENIYTEEEEYISKVFLNGLYGIPALRSHFNIFRWIGNENSELKNIINGFVNNERNIVFSVFVTAVSLYNLLEPLKYLTQEEIDDNLIYCDTDSLYIKDKVRHKLPSKLFNDYHLGKWSFDHENIKMFYVLNHKKYTYYAYNKKAGKDKITIKSGGVPHKSFNTNMSFEKFVNTQFSDGVKINNLKSIYNNQGNISIYRSVTELKQGKGYPIFSHDEVIHEMKNNMMSEMAEFDDGNVDNVLYIESNLGSMSLSDIRPVMHEQKGKSISTLKRLEQFIIRKKYLNM